MEERGLCDPPAVWPPPAPRCRGRWRKSFDRPSRPFMGLCSSVTGQRGPCRDRQLGLLGGGGYLRGNGRSGDSRGGMWHRMAVNLLSRRLLNATILICEATGYTGRLIAKAASDR